MDAQGSTLPSIAPGEISAGVTSAPSQPPGYLTLPHPGQHPVNPQDYSYGFNKKAKMIGCNLEAPYPFKNPHYHNHNFFRGSSWMMVPIRDDRDTDFEERRKKFEENKEDIPEHLIDDDVEVYRKLTLERQARQREREEKKTALRCVPQHIKDTAGHMGPSHTTLTSQQYGQYLDLLTPPLKYPHERRCPMLPMTFKDKFKYSNMSDHKPIPEHAFAVDPKDQISEDGTHYQRGFEGAIHHAEPVGVTSAQKTTFLTSYVNSFGQAIGERRPGCTFPVYHPTGLELNRPTRNCVSILEGPGGGGNFATQQTVRASQVPGIYKRYERYSSAPGDDPETEHNPKTVHHRRLCAPFAGCARNVNPKDNPCHNEFSQGESFLPRSMNEIRQDKLTCDVDLMRTKPDDKSKRKVGFEIKTQEQDAECAPFQPDAITFEKHNPRRLKGILKTHQNNNKQSESEIKQQQQQQQQQQHQDQQPRTPCPPCQPPPFPRRHLDFYYTRMGREPPLEIKSLRVAEPKRWRYCRVAPMPSRDDLLMAEVEKMSKEHEQGFPNPPSRNRQILCLPGKF